MFSGGSVSKEDFLRHIDDQGALWLDTIVMEGITILYFLSIDGNRRVQITIQYDEIPKQTALSWLRQLGLRK